MLWACGVGRYQAQWPHCVQGQWAGEACHCTLMNESQSIGLLGQRRRCTMCNAGHRSATHSFSVSHCFLFFFWFFCFFPLGERAKLLRQTCRAENIRLKETPSRIKHRVFLRQSGWWWWPVIAQSWWTQVKFKLSIYRPRYDSMLMNDSWSFGFLGQCQRCAVCSATYTQSRFLSLLFFSLWESERNKLLRQTAQSDKSAS